MPARRPLLLAVPLLTSALLLAACVPTAAPDATSTPTSTSTGKPTSGASPSATPAPDASPAAETGIPVGIGCNELITPQQIYDYNPNFGLAADFVPEAGTLAAQAVAASGLACRWTNQTSGDTIDVSVAHLDSASTARRRAELAATSTSVSAYGPDGYFDQGDLASAAQAFAGEFWVAAASIAFFAAEDAEPIMRAAITAVG
ncbi:arginyl-tRNA synthetase [Salinibacterium sp.]|uniref:arginyl-tRNA synthetase n=1 Tax=Salinibacterium sp. TaxID=1915057 RepID=UPI00286D41FB|nr:arginyl-tRNA synthetase [Salinibacterium sp.]